MRTSVKTAIPVVLRRIAGFALAVGAFLSPTRALAQVSVTISPSAINLPPGATQQFAAVVTGSANTGVSWTVLEPSGGTIDGSGLYTAPLVVGAYHVLATSQADATRSATATVALPGFVRYGLNVEHSRGSAVLLPNGKILFAGGCTTNLAEIYDPVADRSTNITGMLVPRCTQTTTPLPNGKILIAGGQTAGGDTATAELFDPGTETFTATGSMTVPRAGHAALLLPNGNVLIVGGGTCAPICVTYNSAEIYNPSAGTFSATGNMAFHCSGPIATLLPNGTVLIAGGVNSTANPCVDNPVAEIYDPSTATFSQTGTMVGAASEVASTAVLTNGKVLFVGGINSATAAISGVAELYDPSTGTFTQTGSLNIPRALAAATALPNGEVLIADGVSTTTYPLQSELYDVATGLFTLSGSSQEARIYASSTLLPNGEVLIANGGTASTEFYDPTTGTFNSNSVFMKVTRANHRATTLPDGTVLVVGGQEQLGQGNVQATAEIYNPWTAKFTLTGSMTAAREYHTATLLPNGQVLIVGGFTSPVENTIVTTAELFNSATGTFTLTGGPLTPRAQHTATLLQNGKVLILGGQSLNPNSPGLASAELYDPSTGTFSSAGNMNFQRYGHTATLFNDGSVLIAGGIPSSPFFVPPNSAPPAELYDPTAGTFTPLTSATDSFYFPGPNGPGFPFDSTLLPSGNVLASLAFIFDPTTEVFTTVPGGVSSNAQAYKLLTLPNGEVLVAGGTGGSMLFDPASDVYSPPLSAPIARTSPSANLLSTGQVLVAGGATHYQVDLYQPAVAVPAPTVASISPNPVTGFSPVTITVQGANFAPGAVVMDDYQPLQTTFVSSTQLTAVFPQSELLLAGNHTIQVQNIQDARVAGIGLQVVNPQMIVSTGSLTFGNVTLGTNASQNVTFTNEGNATLTLNSFGISGTNNSDFTIATGGTTCPLQGGTLTPLASCVINIQFAPSAVGLLDAELTASYQTPTSPQIIPLTGTGVGVPAATVMPASLAFGNQNVGTTSAAQTVTITSAGTAALGISNISATIGYQLTHNCPQSLAINASCQIFVTFAPSVSGANAGTLTITANDSPGQHVVQLTGTGIGVSTSAIAPLSFAFGNQAIGTTSTAQQVTVASIGTGNLMISAITLTDTADFKQTNNCPASLASNTNCSIAVTFAPASAGNISGSLVVTANDGPPHTIQLSGTGTNFTMAPASGASSSTTVSAGQPANFQLSLSPQGFSGTVTLSCTEPTPIPNTTCAVSPTQTTLSGSAAVPVTVTLSTMARSGLFAPNHAPRFPRLGPGKYGAVRWSLFLMMALALLAAFRETRGRVPLVISAFFLLMLLAAGCGSSSYSGGGMGGSAGTPAGTYQLVVSASSSGVTRTTTLTLTVQ